MTEVADGKDLWMMGGGDLAAQLAEAGLLDQLLVQIAPVTLGAGRPLFPRRFDLRPRLLNSRFGLLHLRLRLFEANLRVAAVELR